MDAGREVVLIIVRHGESIANLEKIVQGARGNHPLSTLGRKQAEKAGEALRREFPFSAVYSSHLARAHETAELVISHGMPDSSSEESGISSESARIQPEIKTDRRLGEMDFGRFEGRPTHEFRAELNRLKLDRSQYHLLEPEGGETIQKVQGRTDDFLQALCSDIEKHNLSKILLVSHGTCIKAFLLLLVDKYECSMPKGDTRYRDDYSPNAGFTKILLTFGPNHQLKRMECTNLFDGSHVAGLV